MEEEWATIKEFPNYEVSNLGNVRNAKFDRPVAVTYNGAGVAIVGLMDSTKQNTRSVKVLVAEAWLPKKNPLFNTPINLDGDSSNNSVENLAWRPRWFAWKYHQQFDIVDVYTDTKPIRDVKTGVVYSDIAEAGLVNGLLFSELEISVTNRIPVFPIWHNFEWA